MFLETGKDKSSGKFLRRGLIRYYVLHQCHTVHPKPVVVFLEAVAVLQVCTLLVPLTREEGLLWEYDTFWPLWWLLNIPGRPDRVLLDWLKVSREQIVVIGCCVLVGKLSLQVVMGVYLSAMRSEKYEGLLRSDCKIGICVWIIRAERVILTLFSRLLALPLVWIFASSLGLSSVSQVISVFGLIATLTTVLLDRVNTCDIQWQPRSVHPHKASSQFQITAMELTATFTVAICRFRFFILAIVSVACGGYHACHIYACLPYRSNLMNSLASFKGVMLVYEVLLLTLAFCFNSLTLTPTVSLVLVTPFLFLLNYNLILYLSKRISHSKTIKSELIHDFVLRSVLNPAKNGQKQVDSRLNEVRMTNLSLYPLLWTAYLYILNGEVYFMKLIQAKLALMTPKMTDLVAYEVCITRLIMKIRENAEDETLHNFLRLKKFQEQ